MKRGTPISQIKLARQLLDTDENGRSVSKSKLDNILINLIKEKGNDKEVNSENIISRILGQNASSYHRSGKNRKYRDLLRGTFNVEVTRIERQDDPNTISGKIGDFSHTTITDLMQKGEEETKTYLNEKR